MDKNVPKHLELVWSNFGKQKKGLRLMFPIRRRHKKHIKRAEVRTSTEHEAQQTAANGNKKWKRRVTAGETRLF